MFERIGLYPNPTRDESFEALLHAAMHLSARGMQLLVEERYREPLKSAIGVRFVPEEAFYGESDLIISFGGDGTLLSATHGASLRGVPILGVNFGHVGFMTGLEASDMEKICYLNEDYFRIEERMMLSVRHRGKEYHALNEACVVSKNLCTLSAFDVTVDENYIGHYHADGIIVATSTGSTAYSLSAGGAAVDPRLRCICITPICPHSLLRARPIIEPPTARVHLTHIAKGRDAAVLCVDGHGEIELCDEPVEISRSERITRLLLPKNHNFCNVLYSKFFERN